MDDRTTSAPSAPSSPWSIEHYGFDVPAGPPPLAAAQGARRGPAQHGAPTPRAEPRRASGRLGVLAAAVLLSLGLAAGGAGFAAVQASSVDDGGGRGDGANLAAFDRGDHTDRGHGR